MASRTVNQAVNLFIIPGAIVSVVALIAAAAIWRGFVLSILWGWFVVPLFGLPALSIPYAIGLGMLVGFFTASSTDEKKSFGEKLGHIFITPLVSLFIGYIVTLFL